MSVNKPIRKTPYSPKHLATNYDWQSLRKLIFPQLAIFFASHKVPWPIHLFFFFNSFIYLLSNPPLSWPSKQAAPLFAIPPPDEDLFLNTHMQTKDAKPKLELKEQQQQSPKKPTLTIFQATSSNWRLLKRHTNLRFVSWNCNSTSPKSRWCQLKQQSHLMR